MKNNEVKTFYCYDTQLSKYLVSKGFRYLTRARHFISGNEFTLFIRTPSLNEYIDKWHQSKEILK